MSKVVAKIREEVEKLIPPTVFFLVTFSLVSLIRWLMLKGTGVPLSSPGQIFLGALVMGKAVLIADMLPLINKFPNKPLIYNVTWKSVIYVVVSAGIHYLERLIDFWRESGSFVKGNEELLAKVVWPHFWAIQIFLTMAILSYCVMHEVSRALGREKLREMFFGVRGGGENS